MDDLISRQAAIALADTLKDDLPDDERIADAVIAHNEGVLEYQTKLSLLPSAQPERKKGRWTRPNRENTYERFCSECGGKAWYCGKGDYPFCPNCGAEMEGEANV